MNYWVAAARPKTLTAGFVPVLVGSAIAFHEGSFQLFVFFATLFGAIAIQIGTNYVNDAADFEKGADTSERLGPPRMANSGHLSPKQLYVGAGFFFLLAFLFGAYLISIAGIGMLWIGLFSIFFAVIYTAGPFPLAYLGLGDLFVLIFFGFVAVLGTEYAHTGAFSTQALILALAIGLHGVSLIAVNNLRDIPTDAKVGKKTLSLRIGDTNSRFYYAATVLLPFLIWFPFGYRLGGISFLLPYLAIPLAIKNILSCFKIEDRRQFNPLLGKSAGVQLLFGIFLSLALVLAA